MGSVEPPLKKASSNRANIQGASYLYGALDAYTACAEVRPDKRTLISCAKLKLLKDFDLFNMCPNKGIECPEFEKENKISLNTALSQILHYYQFPNIGDEIYTFTQIISDRIRKTGLDGIIYISAITGGQNVVLFNSHKSYVEFVSSEPLLLGKTQHSIYRLNNGEQLPESENIEFDTVDIDKAQDCLKKKIDYYI